VDYYLTIISVYIISKYHTAKTKNAFNSMLQERPIEKLKTFIILFMEGTLDWYFTRTAECEIDLGVNYRLLQRGIHDLARQKGSHLQIAF
jgi:hypothetical protein